MKLRRIFATAILLFTVAMLSAAVVEAGPGIATVETDKGIVQGYVRNGINTFHGIPYGVVNERFKPAEEVEAWDGIFFANAYGPISMQPQTAGGTGSTWEEPRRIYASSESPLNLNVWTPGLDDAKRPVMVWLHGGGFSTGSAQETAVYDGAALSRKGDVVVVSVNHRLNVLGHFDLSAYGDEYKFSANIGIVDLIDALEWIHTNIAAFGGDPDNITLFGESGGGAKILALMSSPYAKGLFKRGIIESGATETMGVIFTDQEPSRRVVELTMEYLGITDPEELQSVPYDELTAASDKALAAVAEEYQIPAALGEGYGLAWEPVIDGDFLPENPVNEDGFADGAEEYGMLIGSNLTEWSAISLLSDVSKTQFDNPNTWSEEETDERLEAAYGDKADKIVNAFLEAYPDKTKADAVFIDSSTIRIPMLKIMNAKASTGDAPVYAYLFSWESPVMNGVYTSYHTSEIPFVFNNIDKADTTIGGGEEAQLLSDRMSQAWINFARTGNPSVEGLPEWEAYTPEGGATMIFDNTVRLVHHHDAKLLDLLLED